MTIRFYVGGGKDGILELSTLRLVCAEKFTNGFTISYGEGGYVSHGKLITEQSAIVTVLNAPYAPQDCVDLCKYIGQQLGQECVAYELTGSQVEFVKV